MTAHPDPVTCVGHIDVTSTDTSNGHITESTASRFMRAGPTHVFDEWTLSCVKGSILERRSEVSRRSLRRLS